MIQGEVERVQEQDHAGPAGPPKSLVFIHREQMYGYQGGGGWEELGGWDWHIYIINTMYNIDN